MTAHIPEDFFFFLRVTGINAEGNHCCEFFFFRFGRSKVVQHLCPCDTVSNQIANGFGQFIENGINLHFLRIDIGYRRFPQNCLG